MRTFIAAAALLVVAAAILPKQDMLKVLDSLRSWEGQVMEAAGNARKGKLAFFKGLVSNDKAYRLQNGQYCREMVANRRDTHTYFTIPKGTYINPSGRPPDEDFLSKWTGLPVVSSYLPSVDVRCLVPQRALAADASENRGSKWRQVHGSGEWMRLELPRSGMPCVRLKCRGELRCEQTSSVPIPMCTDGDLGELSLTEIFAAAIDVAASGGRGGRRGSRRRRISRAGVAESAEPVSQNPETAESAEPVSQNSETALKPVTPATSTRGETDNFPDILRPALEACAGREPGLIRSLIEFMKE